jgi:hypothetical protein
MEQPMQRTGDRMTGWMGVMLWAMLMPMAMMGQAPGSFPGAGKDRQGFAHATAAATQPLGVFYSASGLLSLSVDGYASMAPFGNVHVRKPAGATVRAAFLACATRGSSGYKLVQNDVGLAATRVTWNLARDIGTDIGCYAYLADVTDIVKPVVDAAAPGITSLVVTEANPKQIEGEILAVVFEDPSVRKVADVLLLFGAQMVKGDSFAIHLPRHIDAKDPELILDFGVGISWGCQNAPINVAQRNEIDVNDRRLTSSAGGYDDADTTAGVDNGMLFTVGGVDDTPCNPPPYSFPLIGSHYPDDELYSLVPFVSDGDSIINFRTFNPSNNDNLFFAHLVHGSANRGHLASLSMTVSAPDTIYHNTSLSVFSPEVFDIVVTVRNRDTVATPAGMRGILGLPSFLQDAPTLQPDTVVLPSIPPKDSVRYSWTVRVVMSPGDGHTTAPSFTLLADSSGWLGCDRSVDKPIRFKHCKQSLSSQLAVQFVRPDTILYDDARRASLPDTVAFSAVLSNRSAWITIRDCEVTLPTPAGFKSVPGSLPYCARVPLIAGLDSAVLTWRFVVMTPPAHDALVSWRLRCTWSSDSVGRCPVGVASEIVTTRFWRGKIAPNLICRIEAPDSIAVTGIPSAYQPNPFPVTFTVQNASTFTVGIASGQLHLPAGDLETVPPQDILFPPVTLAPGATASHTWTIRIPRRDVSDRRPTLSLSLVDSYAMTVQQCSTTLFVPGMRDNILCTTTGPGHVGFNPRTGTTQPDSILVQCKLENHVDVDVIVQQILIDLSRAPHLGLAPGETLARPNCQLGQNFRRVFDWRLQVLPPVMTAVRDTLRFVYSLAGETAPRSCELFVFIEPLLAELVCALDGADTLALDAGGRRYAPAHASLEYSLKNAGSASIDLRSAELTAVAPASIALDSPSVRALPSLVPMAQSRLAWSYRPLTSRFDRSVLFAVDAADTSGAVVSRCTRNVFLPAVRDNLPCAAVAPDTIRYDRFTDTWSPNPFPAILRLGNALDTAQTGIEISIDLSSAPHLRLSAGEVNAKTVALIDSHATESVLYNLEVAQKTDTPVAEKIAIRYRHSEDTEWNRCDKDILIQGEKRIVTASCSARGHDTIWIVAPYETIIPVPLQLQHSIVNNGNVPLTLCSAAILLPAGCTLAQGSDSVQSFGTILPGRSISREWFVNVDALTARPGARDIRWKWNCAETREDSSCTHTVRIVPNGAHGIVFTPWLLRFHAKENGPLPASETVQLWTGTTTLPWQLQAQSSWLDLQPLSGNNDEIIAVRPNTTALAPAVYNDNVGIWSVPATTSVIEVEYTVQGLTGMEELSAPERIVLGQNYPNPVRGISQFVLRISEPGWVSMHVTDLFGRVVFRSQKTWLHAGSHTLSIDASRLAPGMYLCMISAGGALSTRMFVKN